MSAPPSLLQLTGPAALRALAHAFVRFHEFDRFVGGLQAALDQSEHFERLTIRLDRSLGEAPAHFSSGTLTLPLADAAGRFGTLQVAPHRQRPFGPEDLHLLAGLADFLSATLTHALRLQEAERSRELLRFLLNQAPVGIAAYGADHRLLVANDLARRWLGEAGVPFEELQRSTGGFHLRASGKLIYGEARRMAEDASGSWIVVLQDLAPEQGRLLELVRRETYRALAEGRRLGFALVESAQLRDGMLRRLPALREALREGEAAGPYDAHRVGVILPELDGLALRARLRRLGREALADAGGLRLGYAELGREVRTPEALLAAALEHHGPFADRVRPALLVHDDNAAVTDAFALVLGREFRVVQSTASERTRELLAREPFEGFVTELELRNGQSGVELARYAREQQPGIRPFFTTVQQARHGLPPAAAEGGAVVLEKPFDVAKLTRLVRERLEEGRG
ncbi:MAG: hypothetical protein JNG83_10085 [Opitutaceae bacterium]|nr:hypothetical protein [Opitutaceae bacterium]